MKRCSICQEVKDLICFDIQSTGILGHRADCKECRKRFLRSERGLVKSLYANQKAKSRKRNHPPPSYTEDELFDWVTSQLNFKSMYSSWVSSGYLTDFKPSIDRVDDYKPYTLSNIALVTTKENIDRYYKDAKEGINVKSATAVNQYTFDGVFVASHHSYMAAARSLGHSSVGNIRNVAEGLGKTAYGFLWKRNQ